MSASVTHGELEDFLFLEAALLDNWQLDEWLALFVEGARYFIPPAGADDDADPATSLFYVADKLPSSVRTGEASEETHRPCRVSALALPAHGQQRALARRR